MTTPEAFSGPKTAKGRNFSILGPFLAPFELWGRPRGAKWCPKHFHTLCLGGTHPYHVLGPLNGPLRPPKGPVLASIGPFGGPGGPRRAPGGQIWSRLPPIGPSELDSCSPHTLPWYQAPSGHPGAQERPDTRSKCVVTMCPTQASQSGAVGTKSGPSGPSEDLRGPQKGHSGPKRALLGAPGVS